MTRTSESPLTLRGLRDQCDREAVSDPGRYGQGYHETQLAWSYDPAFEVGRETLFRLLREIVERELNGTFVQLGLGRRGGVRRTLEKIAARVVTVEIDPARVRAYVERECPSRIDDLIVGDSTDPAVAALVRERVGTCDLLLIDADDSFESVRADWNAYSTLVRPGGIVAIVDSSQARDWDGREIDVDRCILELDTCVLAPNGIRLQRIGNDRAVHWYEQPSNPPTRDIPVPASMAPTPHGERIGTAEDLAVWAFGKRRFAIPSGHASFDPRRIADEEYALVVPLREGDPLAAARAFGIAEQELAHARALLLRGDVEGARAVAGAVRRDAPQLRAWLLDALAEHPYSRRAILGIGTLGVLTDEPKEGRAWLEAALDRDVTDTELLQLVAAVQLRIDHDEVGARATIAQVQRKLDATRLQSICAQLHDASPGIWRYPQLLEGVRGVIQVGAHRGEEIDAFTRAGFTRQLFLEPDPAAFEGLHRACRREDGIERRALRLAVGAAPDHGVLRYADGSRSGSLCAPRVGASESGAEVEIATLDELVEQGVIDPRQFELLVVDAEGSELEVLRGATKLLPHLDVLCVAVFYEPIYDGAASPVEIHDFVGKLDEFGFLLRAHDSEGDPRRGNAIFTRGTRRRRPER
ncbi:MAG: FkbM family methyltransferase [Planctomycetes bacterium]|nr:FkbM family methyltransferase [Planctomycetota bacterium]